MNTAKLQAMLKKEEGEVNHAYRDQLGFLTIGVGHLIDPAKGGSISHAAAMFILGEDIRDKCGAAEAFPWFAGLSENRQTVIEGMAFQMGVAGVAKFPGMIQAIEAGDYARAAAEMKDSEWHRQTRERCERLARIMETDEWPSDFYGGE